MTAARGGQAGAAGPARPRAGIVPAYLAALGAAAAVIVVPGHVNVLGAEMVVEAEKALLLRSLALVMAGGFAVASLLRGGPGVADWRRWARHPIVLAALAFTAASAVASLFSVSPALSWSGGYERRMGMPTLLADLVIFLALATLALRRAAIDGLVDAMIVGSIFPALYGTFEAWTYSMERVVGTAGNPGFLAAYLIMVWPFTAVRGVEAWHRGRGRLLRTAAYGGLVACQTVALLSTSARGPLLGLTAGLVVMGGLYAGRLPRSNRPLWPFLASVGVAIAVVTAATGGAPIGRRPSVPDVNAGTARMRLVMWQDASQAVVDRPARLLTGAGPETTALVLGPYQSPEVSWIEGAGIYGQLDRAHNIWLDAVLTTGLAGLAALLALWVTALSAASALRTRDPGDLLAAAILGSLVAHLVEVQFSFETVATSLLFWFELGLLAALTPRHAAAAETGAAIEGATVRLRAMLAFAPALMVGAMLVPARYLQASGLNLTAVCLPVATAAGALAAVRTGGRASRAWWRVPAAILATVLVVAGVLWNISASRATVFEKRAQDAVLRQDWATAERWYAAAASAEPTESFHVERLVLVLLQEARTADDEAERLDYLRRALSLAERRLTGGSPDAIQALAQVHLTWADLVRDVPVRTARLGSADRLFARLAGLRPSDPTVWGLWSRVDLLRGDYAGAREKADRSLLLRNGPTRTP